MKIEIDQNWFRGTRKIFLEIKQRPNYMKWNQLYKLLRKQWFLSTIMVICTKNVFGSIIKTFCGLSPVEGHLHSSWTLSNQTTWAVLSYLFWFQTMYRQDVRMKPCLLKNTFDLIFKSIHCEILQVNLLIISGKMSKYAYAP